MQSGTEEETFWIGQREEKRFWNGCKQAKDKGREDKEAKQLLSEPSCWREKEGMMEAVDEKTKKKDSTLWKRAGNSTSSTLSLSLSLVSHTHTHTLTSFSNTV